MELRQSDISRGVLAVECQLWSFGYLMADWESMLGVGKLVLYYFFGQFCMARVVLMEGFHRKMTLVIKLIL